MNENAKGTTMYETVPVVAELNRVTGFDPLKFARRISQPGNPGARLQLDLKYKKLWFRLKYPQGRLKVIPLRITEQIAIFEAKVLASHIFSNCLAKKSFPLFSSKAGIRSRIRLSSQIFKKTS